MSVVRYLPNSNNLGRKLNAPGGKKISEVVAGAETELAQMAPAALAAIDASIAAIAAATASPVLSAQDLEIAYQEANTIHGAAAVFGLPDLGEAAWSLCELIDVRGLLNSKDAIVSHVNCIRLLRMGEAVSAAERAALLGGLRDLRDHTKKEAATI